MMAWWNDGFEGILSIQDGYFHAWYPPLLFSKIALFQMNGVAKGF
jgi:hypothetical protein